MLVSFAGLFSRSFLCRASSRRVSLGHPVGVSLLSGYLLLYKKNHFSCMRLLFGSLLWVLCMGVSFRDPYASARQCPQIHIHARQCLPIHKTHESEPSMYLHDNVRRYILGSRRNCRGLYLYAYIHKHLCMYTHPHQIESTSFNTPRTEPPP